MIPPFKDPLCLDVFAISYKGNVSEARFYSRKLSERYPQSEAALILWGEFAYRLRYYNEAAVYFSEEPLWLRPTHTCGLSWPRQRIPWDTLNRH